MRAIGISNGSSGMFGAQERGDEQVARAAQPAVDLQPYAIAKAVHHQHLLRFGETELPREAGVLHRRDR